MSMDFPANPAVGDVHAFTNEKDRKISFEWDGITWSRMDDPPLPPPPAGQAPTQEAAQAAFKTAWRWTQAPKVPQRLPRRQER